MKMPGFKMPHMGAIRPTAKIGGAPKIHPQRSKLALDCQIRGRLVPIILPSCRIRAVFNAKHYEEAGAFYEKRRSRIKGWEPPGAQQPVPKSVGVDFHNADKAEKENGNTRKSTPRLDEQ